MVRGYNNTLRSSTASVSKPSSLIQLPKWSLVLTTNRFRPFFVPMNELATLHSRCSLRCFVQIPHFACEVYLSQLMKVIHQTQSNAATGLAATLSLLGFLTTRIIASM